MKDKIKIVSLYKSIGMFIVVIAVMCGICDMCFRVCTCNFLIYGIEEEIFWYIYAAIVTIASLGGALLSISISVSDKKYLGLHKNELLEYSGYVISFELVKIMAAIIVVTVAIVFNLRALELGILLFVTYKICGSYLLFYKIITNNGYQLKIIDLAISKKLSDDDTAEIIHLLQIWYEQIKKAIQSHDTITYNECIKLIYKVNSENNTSKKSVDITTEIDAITQSVFSEALFKLGITKSYDCFIKPYEYTGEDSYFIETFLRKSLRQLIYFDDRELYQAIKYANVEDIIYHLEIETGFEERIGIKSRILFYEFDNILENSIVTEQEKKEIINDFIFNLCHEANHVEAYEAIKIIVKRCILQNDDDEKRLMVYRLLIYNLYLASNKKETKGIISIIALLFRGIFFYAFYETEMLNKDFRMKLKSLLSLSIESKDTAEVSICTLIKRNSEKIIKFLVDDGCTNVRFDEFDYFPETGGAKFSVWENGQKIQFAFYMYSVVSMFSDSWIKFIDYFDDKKIDFEVCYQITNMYTAGSKVLKQKVFEELHELEKIMGEEAATIEKYEDIFNFFNEKLKKFEKEKNEHIGTDGLKEKVIEKFNENLKSNQYNMKTGDVGNINAKQYQVGPRITFKYENFENGIAMGYVVAVRDIINNRLKELDSTVELSFDSEGISTLIDKIENYGNIKSRSYTFIDDWALSASRNDKNYLRLTEMISGIKRIDVRGIVVRAFLTVKDIIVNASMDDYKYRQLTDDECKRKVDNYEIADGIYKINNAELSQLEALKYVKNNYFVDTALISVDTNFGPKDGFKVITKIKRNKKK